MQEQKRAAYYIRDIRRLEYGLQGYIGFLYRIFVRNIFAKDTFVEYLSLDVGFLCTVYFFTKQTERDQNGKLSYRKSILKMHLIVHFAHICHYIIIMI